MDINLRPFIELSQNKCNCIIQKIEVPNQVAYYISYQNWALNISTAGNPARGNHQLTFVSVYELFSETLHWKLSPRGPRKPGVWVHVCGIKSFPPMLEWQRCTTSPRTQQNYFSVRCESWFLSTAHLNLAHGDFIFYSRYNLSVTNGENYFNTSSALLLYPQIVVWDLHEPHHMLILSSIFGNCS